MTLVGYELYTTTDGDTIGAWVLQNSWGDQWGDNGFIKVEATNGLGVCGVNFWIQGAIAEWY